MSFHLQKLTPTDVPRLRDLAIRTFTDTYAAYNTPENMRDYIAHSFSPMQLVGEIEDGDTFFYFVMLGQIPVGYLQLHLSEQQNAKALEIVRIYVAKEHHGIKAGQALFDKAVAMAQANRADYLWLGVWEENPKAIAFYKRNGMIPFGTHIFKLGDDCQTDILMKLIMDH